MLLTGLAACQAAAEEAAMPAALPDMSRLAAPQQVIASNAVIELYKAEWKIPALADGEVRFCRQPMGIVAYYMIFDLAGRKELTIYPGTHAGREVRRLKLTGLEAKEIREAVLDPKFERIPVHSRMGLDGEHILVEFKLGDKSGRRLVWCPEDAYLAELVKRLNVFNDRAAEKNNPPARGPAGAGL